MLKAELNQKNITWQVIPNKSNPIQEVPQAL